MRKKTRRLGVPSRARVMLKYANSFVGIQFRSNPPPLEIDCSQFTQMVFAKVGVKLPRTSQDQAKQGVEVSFTDLRPGDLVFYHIPDRNRVPGSVGHVAIYAGKGKIVHCLPTSNFFLTDMNKPYWKVKYLFVRRVL
ncbi:C40 family peptidase [Paenibacillus xylanilyticus]|uniref:C40 family peptidase n=1 Tax=Paenibacillus xylanilyticus TaxID=248903 RepID=UPI003AAE4DF4